ncbi:MAG: hypothetical protein WC966_02480 [Bradymonadales bacterium]|jgi:hypothetical protein
MLKWLHIILNLRENLVFSVFSFASVFLLFFLAYAQKSEAQTLATEMVNELASTRFVSDSESFKGYVFERPANWALSAKESGAAVLLEAPAVQTGAGIIIKFCDHTQDCSLEAAHLVLKSMSAELEEIELSTLSQKVPLQDLRMLKGRYPNGEMAAFVVAKPANNLDFMILAGSSLSYFYAYLGVFFRVMSSIQKAT